MYSLARNIFDNIHGGVVLESKLTFLVQIFHHFTLIALDPFTTKKAKMLNKFPLKTTFTVPLSYCLLVY